MPERKTVRRARKARREGKAPTTQAGEFVREEIEHVRKGKHGARSTKQAIAIGLSKARRSSVRAHLLLEELSTDVARNVQTAFVCCLMRKHIFRIRTIEDRDMLSASP